MDLTEVARRRGISKQTASQIILDAEFLSLHPERCENCKTEKDVRETREKFQRALDQDEENRKLGGLPKSWEIRQDDFNVWAPAYTGPPFNFLHIDLPWGVGQDKFGQKSRTDEVYDDSPEVFELLCDTLQANFGRLVHEKAHGVFWFPIKWHQAILDRLMRMGWDDVNPVPFVWAKPSAGIIPRSRTETSPPRDLRQCYETAFICARGDIGLEPVRNWYPGDPPKDREHQSQKNEEMLEHLLRAFVDENTRLLDPTCGSGVAIRVAKRLKVRYALGLEISEQSSLLAQAALAKVKPGETLLKVNGTLEDLGAPVLKEEVG
jgi:hypothetical protein